LRLCQARVDAVANPTRKRRRLPDPDSLHDIDGATEDNTPEVDEWGNRINVELEQLLGKKKKVKKPQDGAKKVKLHQLSAHTPRTKFYLTKGRQHFKFFIIGTNAYPTGELREEEALRAFRHGAEAHPEVFENGKQSTNSLAVLSNAPTSLVQNIRQSHLSHGTSNGSAISNQRIPTTDD
jgi:hypothetical protein